ncbi:MAG: class I SAM-dependent methyltransferase [Leptospiraceae bacterium]|nr:class I SAM-dependent methyltransferase [Leptospiraceae bacterium]MCP5503279.1 class I SAM-dependent methyltransferase [Leptospiraceae bacterium]
MTEMELLIDFHLDAERQGPGSDEDTLKALSFIDIPVDSSLKIADIGCGSGAQTMRLAKSLNGKIIAVDLFSDFLVKLNERAKTLNLEDRISTIEKSMNELPFNEEEYDLLWSEGAIYNIGFESGIKSWNKYLKAGAYIAVSEITWKTMYRPKEIEEHWNNEYPEIGTASEKIKILEENGFSPMGFFFLPEKSWIDNYYSPMEKRFDTFLKKHGNSDIAEAIVEGEKHEIYLYKKYKDYFSYGFYIARKLPAV